MEGSPGPGCSAMLCGEDNLPPAHDLQGAFGSVWGEWHEQGLCGGVRQGSVAGVQGCAGAQVVVESVRELKLVSERPSEKQFALHPFLKGELFWGSK